MARVTPFGISALSKSNHEHAYLNEIMCNKDIGEIAVRTKGGDTASYNYFAGLTSSINLLTQASAFYCMDGMIYSLSIPDKTMPMVLGDGDVFEFVCDKPAKRLIFAVDASAVKTEENMISESLIDDVHVSFKIGDISIDNLVQNLSSEVIELPNMVDSFTISDFEIYVTNVEGDYTLYLNSILCLIE
jgi:hypothetical protein